MICYSSNNGECIMEVSLRGKNAIVCGSTDGIGKSTALEFAKSGATQWLMN